MNRPTCETCPYWESLDCNLGYCRRRAPRPYSDLMSEHEERFAAEWPSSTPDDWCGEHPDFPEWIESQRKPIDH
jgi:hypothetical protein